MQSFIKFFILTCFCLWLIPLGQFIKKDRQEQACGGQRAICMCLAKGFKKTSNGPVKFTITTNTDSANQKESSGSGGAGNYYVSTDVAKSSLPALAFHFDSLASLPSLLFIRNIEHVPKF